MAVDFATFIKHFTKKMIEDHKELYPEFEQDYLENNWGFLEETNEDQERD